METSTDDDIESIYNEIKRLPIAKIHKKLEVNNKSGHIVQTLDTVYDETLGNPTTRTYEKMNVNSSLGDIGPVLTNTDVIYNERKRKPITKTYKNMGVGFEGQTETDKLDIGSNRYPKARIYKKIEIGDEFENSAEEREIYSEGGYTFSSMVIPVNNIVTAHNTNSVRFNMKRKNSVISLQWENFSGIVASTGDSKIVFVQSVSCMPRNIMSYPILVKHNGTKKFGEFVIDPHSTNGNIYIYLTLDRSETKVGDSFSILSSCVSWIV